jgi:alkylation response protein AidB-like acyl-CoA dehydrogenase
MTTVARRDGDGYVVDGAKVWITNARRSQIIALLCKTDPEATPRHTGMSLLLVEHGPGLTVSRDLPKLGYKGVESCELHFDGFRAPAMARERETFGKPIWRHQSIGNYLADMATKLTAARQLVLHAAERLDTGARSDLEAGMAKLFASEVAMEIALNAVRIHGAYGYSTEFDVERYFRDAPLMIVGEGTNEIQRNVITAQLVARGGLDA